MQAANIEADASGTPDGEYQLSKHEFSNLGRGKYSGTSNIHCLSISFFVEKFNIFFLYLIMFLTPLFGFQNVAQLSHLMILRNKSLRRYQMTMKFPSMIQGSSLPNPLLVVGL